MTLAEAARVMVERVSEFEQSRQAFDRMTFGSHGAYSQAREAYVRDRRLLVQASRDLNDALGRERTREAAEAGSAGAAFFTVNERGG